MAVSLSELDHVDSLESLVSVLREWLRSGSVRVGESLPSARTAAGQVDLDRNTVQKAYAQLEEEGYLKSSPGKGTLVIAVRPEEQRFGWIRYWWPNDSSETPILWNDLLIAPEAILNREARTLEQLDEQEIVVLLGEAGMGKTTEMQRAAHPLDDADRRGALLVELGRFAEATELRLAIAPFIERSKALLGATVFLDSIDELTAAQPHLFETVCDLVRQLLDSNLRVRITCRASAWTSQFRDRLAARCQLKRLPVYELLPLSRSDVKMAAVSRGLDPEAFMKQVDELGIHQFAARPITLQFLLNAYGSGTLSEQPLRSIIESGLEHMVMAADAARADRGSQGALSATDRMAIAQRLAVVHVLCGVDAFHDGRFPNAGSNVIGGEVVNSLPLGPATARLVTPSDLAELFNTALFAPRSGHDYGFAHRTYAEFLAARYLAHTSFQDDQLVRLLWGVRGADRSVPVSVRETVAWLASFRPSIRNLVANTEPQVLLLADTAQLSEQDRADVLRSILHRVDAGEVSWDTQRMVHSFSTKLKHAGLAVQLKEVIADAKRSIDVRDLAIDIASECGVAELCETIFDLCSDASVPVSLRISASSALRVLARVPEGSRTFKMQNLRSILDRADLVDDDQQVIGNVLHVLWPDHLSPAQLFSALDRYPQGNPSLHGAYSSFISSAELPDGLDEAGVLEALAWVAKRDVKHPHLGRDDLDRLAEAVLHRAWELADDPRVLESAVGPFTKRLEQHIPIFAHRRNWDEPSEEQACHAELAKHPARRRKLVSAIIAQLSTTASDKAGRQRHAWMLLPKLSGLLLAADLVWVTEQAIAASGDEQEVWIEAANRLLLWYPESEWSDEQREYVVGVTRRPKRPPELFEWLRAIDIDSKEAERLRESLRQSRAWGRPRKQKRKRHSLRLVLESWLDGSESGQVHCWYTIHRILRMESALDDSPEEHADSSLSIIPSQVWDSAESKLRERILDAAQRFIDSRSPVVPSILSDGEVRGEHWSMLEALRLLVRERPAWIEKKDSQWWFAWAPLIVCCRHEHEDAEELDSVLGQLACHHAVTRCTESVAVLLRSEPALDRSESTLMRFIGHPGHEVVDVVEEFLSKEAPIGPRQVESVFEFLQVASPAHLVDAVTRGIEKRHTEEWAEASVALGAIAANRAAEATWPSIWKAMQEDRTWGKSVLSALAYGVRRQGGGFIQQLTEKERAELLLWMWTVMELGALPDRRGVGAYTPTRDEELSRLRDSLMAHVVASDSPDSELALEGLVMARPENRWFRDCLIRNRENSVRWNRPEPIELVQLLHDPRRRPVTSSDELVAVVLESLRRYEDRLQRQDNPLSTNLWDLVEGGTSSFKGEQHLSDNLRDHLVMDLARAGVIVNREVQIKRPQRHPAEAQGGSLDILVEAIEAPGQPVSRTVVEVKLDTNQSVLTDRVKQLEGRYLEEDHRPSGVYCVAWTGGEKKRYQNPERLQEAIEAAGKDAGRSSLRAPVIVLDCSIRK